MGNKRLGILLALLGLLLVVLVAGNIWRQRSNAPAKEAIKTVKPAKDSKAVSRIRAASGANIIICVLDAARFDHMGCYGYPRPTTPNIDRLAKESLVFERHYCQYPLTEQSTRALFESIYVVPGQIQIGSLIESLQQLSFNTLFFSANPRILGLGPSEIGFDNIGNDAQLSLWDRKRQAEQLATTKPAQSQKEEDQFYRPEYLLAQVNGWLAKKPKQPFFTYIHFIPPHVPYDAPKNLKDIFHGKQPPLYWKAPSAMPMTRAEGNGKAPVAGGSLAASFEETVNLYDANMRWADEAVGKLEQALRKAGLFDNSLLMVMADHGETLGEHGYKWHSDCPYEEALHIPLIMRFPGKAGPRGRIKSLTQTIDLLPTLFDIHNLPWPGTAQGRSLLPLLAGETARANEYSFSAAGLMSREIYIVRDLQSTLLLNIDGKTRALYDSVKDPHQTKNIIQSEPTRAAKLVEVFRQFALAQSPPPLNFIDPTKERPVEKNSEQTQTRNMPEKLKKQLKTLGYLK